MRILIENNFGPLLALGFILGLITPGIDHLPDELIAVFVSCVMFIACFQTDAQELRGIKLNIALGFYLLRFILLPIVLFYVFDFFLPAYSLAVLVLASMPAGVTCPAITGLILGNVSLSFLLTVSTNLLTPFVVPALIAAVSNTEISIDLEKLLIALATIIFLPALLHLPLRRVSSVHKWFVDNAAVLTILCILPNVVLVTAKRRVYFFEQPLHMLEMLGILLLVFAAFYAVSRFVFSKAPAAIRRTLLASSLINNVALGMSVALLYFPPEVALLLLLALIPWIFSLVFVKRFGEKML